MVLNRSVSGQKPPDDPVSEQRRSEEDVSLETGASVEATTNTKVAEPPYTIFDLWRRYLLMSLLSLIGIWSAISNSIYFPAIPTLEREFDVSSEAINLTMVAYLVLQGLAPTLVSNFADTYGRRPMVLIAFCVYIGANIGLAVCNTYWLLVFLRCVQAGGIAQVIAINSGIAGDVCVGPLLVLCLGCSLWARRLALL